MNCVEQLLLLILAVATVSSQQKGKTNDVIKPSENETVCCSRNSVCPTWLICSPQKNCQCGDGHSDVIICNNEKLISAVLNCHCVTYDGESESTFVGSCFYNCAVKSTYTTFNRIMTDVNIKVIELYMALEYI